MKNDPVVASGHVLVHSMTLALGPLQRLPQRGDGGLVLVAIRGDLNRDLPVGCTVFDSPASAG